MGKIIKLENLASELEQIKQKTERIILAGGCFDIIHAGHLEFFRQSKALGGSLFVMLESDESVKKYKGFGRPLHTQNDRALILSHIATVDYILPLPLLKTDQEYTDLVKIIEPDIIAVTIGDPIVSKKRAQAKLVNSTLVEVTNRLTEYSTTKLSESLIGK